MQFAAKSVRDPKDIRIIETDPSGETHEASGLTFGENEIFADERDFQEEEDERGGWDNKLDFLFSCISVSVGLGSKWKIRLFLNFFILTMFTFQMYGDSLIYATKMVVVHF